jgi:hypothetical protein
MVSAIRVSDDKLDVMEEAIDIVSKNAGTRLKQREFLELLLDSDPKEIAGTIMENMKKRMNRAMSG